MANLKFLVTGGAGFIGSNIVEELLTKGYSVRILDNFSTGKKENLKKFINDIELIEGDIRALHNTQKAVKGIDIVLHQAALPSVPRSIKDPLLTNEVNINGTLNMLYSAVEANVKRFVFASSSSVYGNSPCLPKTEGMFLEPLSPYAITKLTGEKYCKVFNEIYGLETVALRYFNVFGPKQNPDSQYSAVIPKFINAIKSNTKPTIYGDGSQSRDFTFVKNIVELNLLAALSTCTTPDVFNCATHSQITLNELVNKINIILGKDIQPIYTAPREGDIQHSFADIENAYKKLKWVPSYQFDEGLLLTVQHYNN